MKLSRILIYFLFFGISLYANTQEFNHFFENKTLRLDYIFSGNAESQVIALDELSSYPEWWGRKHHLSENNLKGYGQVHVFDIQSNELIYTHSFSTLFQEWLTTAEAKSSYRSFENVFLVPFPKKRVRIELVLFNKQGEEENKLIHFVDPDDMLIHEKGINEIPKYRYLKKAKNEDKAIHVVFVAEGYTKREMKKFRKKAQQAMEEILGHHPFDTFQDKFSFIAVESISHQSGVSVPRKEEWKNTAVESNFDTFYSERYLTTKQVKKLHDILAGIPYEQIIILANTDVYGGGGIFNSYTLTTTNNPQFKPVVVHEFGHSFAGLADEYFYEGDALSDFIDTASEPWEKNITSLIDFDSKWKSLLAPNTPIPTPVEQHDQYAVGVYKGNVERAIYTGDINCRMKTNQAAAFCLVCQNAIEQLIRFYTD